MRSAGIASGVWAVVWVFACALALAQPQIPATVPADGQFAGPGVAGPAPMATLDGSIQPPSLDWDPYSAPGTGAPSLFPQDPYLPPGTSESTFSTMRRFLDEVRLDYVWMPGHAADELGINKVELSGTFAIPCAADLKSSLLITPGFAVNYWDGPEGIDLPPQTIDAYLGAGWKPQFSPWFGADLGFRIGIYSDFRRVSNDSIRYTGHAYGVINYSPSFRIKLGAKYLDRVRIRFLPAAGIYWSPNPDIYFDVFFPDPKIAMRLCNVGNTEWWGYMRGEYGGGSWTIRRDGGPGSDDYIPAGSFVLDQFDYNDIRFAVGLEFKRLTGLGLTGLFETGLAFGRELRFRIAPPVKRDLKSTVFVRGGLAF